MVNKNDGHNDPVKITKKMVVGFAFVFEKKPAIANVVEIFQPFKVGNSHTARVDVEVRDDQNVSVDENFVRRRCGWSVSRLSDNLAWFQI